MELFLDRQVLYILHRITYSNVLQCLHFKLSDIKSDAQIEIRILQTFNPVKYRIIVCRLQIRSRFYKGVA